MNKRSQKSSKTRAILAGAAAIVIAPVIASATPIVTVTNLGTPTQTTGGGATATGYTAFDISITADSGDVVATTDLGGPGATAGNGIFGQLLQRWTYVSSATVKSPQKTGVKNNGNAFSLDSHIVADVALPNPGPSEDNNEVNPGGVPANTSSVFFGTGTQINGNFSFASLSNTQDLAYVIIPTASSGSYKITVYTGPAAGGTATGFTLSGTIGAAIPPSGKVFSLTAAGNSAGGTTALSGTYNPNTPTAGVINVVGANPAGYVKGELNEISNGTTGQTQIKFENASGTVNDPGLEVIALNLADSVPGNLSADQQQLINDINDATKGIGPGTASALLPASPYYSVFNTGRSDPYDVLLTVPTSALTGLGSSFLGMDLTQDAALSTLSVVDVAAVPEPASATVILLGAAGLLLGRRKRKIELV